MASPVLILFVEYCSFACLSSPQVALVSERRFPLSAKCVHSGEVRPEPLDSHAVCSQQRNNMDTVGHTHALTHKQNSNEDDVINSPTQGGSLDSSHMRFGVLCCPSVLGIEDILFLWNRRMEKGGQKPSSTFLSF